MTSIDYETTSLTIKSCTLLTKTSRQELQQKQVDFVKFFKFSHNWQCHRFNIMDAKASCVVLQISNLLLNLPQKLHYVH